MNHASRVRQEKDAPDHTLTRTAELHEASRQPADKLKKDKNMEQYDFKLILHHVTTKTGP